MKIYMITEGFDRLIGSLGGFRTKEEAKKLCFELCKSKKQDLLLHGYKDEEVTIKEDKLGNGWWIEWNRYSKIYGFTAIEIH